jgi:capsular polysaccharide biosynthesis protein
LSNEGNTDVVTVTVLTDSPTRSEAIAEAFANEYIEALNESSDLDEDALYNQLETELADLSRRIEILNTTLASAVDRFLPQLLEGIPIDPAFVDPETTTERDLLALEYEQVLIQKIALESGEDIQVNSAILQPASDAGTPFVESSSFEIAAVIAAGFVLGCVIALMWARFSSLVADSSMVAEILHHPISATVPRVRRLGAQPALAITDPPEHLREPMGRLAVAADASSPNTRPSRIVVAGAQRAAGTTTLAMLLASEFIASGERVVLVDADPKSDDLLSVMGAADLTFDEIGQTDPRGFDGQAIVVVGPSASGDTLPRAEVATFLSEVGWDTHVVIVDAGSVLSSAMTVDLCEAADSVLLAVPTRHQRVASLQAVSRIVTRRDLLIVETEPKRRALRVAAPRIATEAAH